MTPVLLLAALATASIVEVQLHGKLPEDAQWPVISADEKQLLYLRSNQDDEAVYVVAAADGTLPRELYTTKVDWFGLLTNLASPQMFAADGRIAVSARPPPHPKLGNDLRGLAVIHPSGKLQHIACEYGSCLGYGFAGDRLVYIDCSGFRASLSRSKLKLADGKTTRVLFEDDAKLAFCLRISPDGRRAAFFTLEDRHNTLMKLHAVDLHTGKRVTTPQFHSEDANLKSLPEFFWDAGSRGLFCHVSTDVQGSRPFELTYFDLETRRGKLVTKAQNYGLAAVLDADHLALWTPDHRRSVIHRLRDGKQFKLRNQLRIRCGQGTRVVVEDLTDDSLRAATIKLPE